METASFIDILSVRDEGDKIVLFFAKAKGLGSIIFLNFPAEGM